MSEQQSDPSVQMIAYPKASQKEFLDKLKEATKVPTTERIRESIDLLMDKYGHLVSSDK